MKKIKDKIFNHPIYIKLHQLFTLEGDLFFAPASLAYYLLFSLMPTLLISAALLSTFASSQMVETFLSYYLNQQQINDLIDFLYRNKMSSFISLGFSALVAFYVASHGINNFFAYTRFKNHLPKLPFFRAKAQSIIITILFLIVTTGLFLFFIVITYYSMVLNLFFTFAIFRFLFLTAILSFSLAFLYRLSSTFAIKWKDAFIGSSIASFGLSSGVLLYDFYLRYIASYDTLYGPISNVIILLFLFYVIGYCVLLGYHIVIIKLKLSVDN